MTEVSTPRSSDRKKHRNFKGLKMDSFPPAASIQGCESLDMSENPITSFRTLETIPTLTHLNIRNTLIESFQFVQPQPKLTHIVVADTPLARYSTIVVMCICTFGEQLQQVNGRPISKDDKKRAGKLHKQLFCYLNNGWLLTGLDPIRCYHFQTRQRRVFQRNGQIPSIPLLVEKPRNAMPKPKPKLKTRPIRATKRVADGRNETKKTFPNTQQINITEATDSLQKPPACQHEEALEQGMTKGILSEPALLTSTCEQGDAAPVPEDTQTQEQALEAQQPNDNASEPDEAEHDAFMISSDDELDFSDEQASASYYSDDDYNENMDPNIDNGNPGSARGESKLMQLIRGSQPYRTYEEDTLEDTIKMLTPSFDPFAGDSSSMSLSACSSCADIRFDSEYFERQNQMLADLDVSSDISEVQLQDSTEPNRYRRRLSTRQRRLSALKFHRRRCQRKSLSGAITQSDDCCTIPTSPRQSLLVPVA